MNAKNYTGLLFHVDRALQAKELHEMQSNAAENLRGVADALFADGDIRAGSACAVDADGNCTLDAGIVYLDGAMRSVNAATLTVPVVGTVSVGIYMQRETVTALQDPDLYDTDKNSPSYLQAGADRIKTTCTWGLAGGGQAGDFYPVWQIVDGAVTPREAAPQLTAITKAIEGYDRESTGGGDYVIEGMEATMLSDDADGRQVFSISAGAARVTGVVVRSSAARRLNFAAVPDVQTVLRETHSSNTTATQRVRFDRTPVLLPAQVQVQRQRTVELTHGPIAGAADVLPETSVVKINSVKQGATIYTQDVDYKLNASQVDWSLPGAEVAPGSKYIVDYEYMSVEPVEDQTPYDFAVTGAVNGSVLLVDYQFALRRIDVIVIDTKSKLNVVKGVPSAWNPVAPSVPRGLIPLAQIWQSWDSLRGVIRDQVRQVSMATLQGYQRQHNKHTLELAELRLAVDVSGRFGGLKRGSFADPMLDNSMRDQGMQQTAMIAGGALQLNEPVQALAVDDGSTTHAMAYTLETLWAQAASSESATIATPAPPPLPSAPPPPPPPPMPAQVVLSPSVDRWVKEDVLAYPGCYYFNTLGMVPGDQINKARDEARDKFIQSMDLSKLGIGNIYMRSIQVQFTIKGFAPGELLHTVAFDGVAVAALPIAGGSLVADATGQIVGTFTVPANLPTGKKTVAFSGASGGSCIAQFTGEVQLKLSVYFNYAVLNGKGFGSEVITNVV